MYAYERAFYLSCSASKRLGLIINDASVFAFTSSNVTPSWVSIKNIPSCVKSKTAKSVLDSILPDAVHTLDRLDEV